MLNHRLPRIVPIRNWTETTDAVLVPATKALVATFFLYAVTGCYLAVIRNGSLLNKSLFYESLYREVSLWLYCSCISQINSLMNGTCVFWLSFLQTDLTGWIQSNKRFDFSTIQTALEVLYRLELYYFMVCFLFLSTIFSLWRTVTHLAFLIFCGP